MPDTADYLITHAVKSLPAYGFDVDANNSDCQDFLASLRNLLSDISRPYELGIRQELANPENRRNEADLRSWCVSETTDLWHRAAGRFRDKVADHASVLLGSQKIDCQTSTLYLSWLADEFILVKAERQAIQRVTPSSPKFRKKRASQKWTPYGIDFALERFRRTG
jgi:hypothetical protein